MSRLTLVRHAQALRFDRTATGLTEAGREQAARLGRWWRQSGYRPQIAVSGPLDHQKETAAIALAELGGPALEFSEEWADYDAEGMLATYAPALARRDPRFAHYWQSWERHKSASDRARHFQRMLEALLQAWRADSHTAGCESWCHFSRRVREGLRRFLRSSQSEFDVVVFTSGGPIGLAVQSILNAPEEKALDLVWTLRNTSLTALLYTHGRATLDVFNTTPHLREPELETRR
jgi:broad specificity phosphatase PhoE